jgi:hypothetical protein
MITRIKHWYYRVTHKSTPYLFNERERYRRALKLKGVLWWDGLSYCIGENLPKPKPWYTLKEYYLIIIRDQQHGTTQNNQKTDNQSC